MRPPVSSGTVYIKDPVNVWNKEQTIGLAELAVRTQAAPMAFDRRGDVLYWDDFESPTAKHHSYRFGSATVNKSTDYSKTGDFSLKCTTAATIAAGDRAGLIYSHNDFHLSTIGTQISFMCADFLNDYEMVNLLYWFDGSDEYRALLHWYNDTGKLWYSDSAGVLTELPGTYNYRHTGGSFATMKLVVDTTTHMYVRALLFGSEIDLSGIAIQNAGASPDRYLYTSFAVYNGSAVSSTMYFDNYLLTGNEPA